MAKSIAKNYIYNLIYQVLVIILPIVTIPYLSRILGAENVGISSYTMSIAAYFILFGTLGVGLYGQREIAYVQESKFDKSKIFYEVIILRFITMAISILIFYFTFASNGEYEIYYMINGEGTYSDNGAERDISSGAVGSAGRRELLRNSFMRTWRAI